MDNRFFMNLALQEALKAIDEGEVPVGAVIAKENTIIGRGYNRIESLNDATAHAEIIAISAAASSIESWRLNECTLYVTMEPCLMCLGAILQSRIEKVVYGIADTRIGALETFQYREEAQRAYGRFPEIEGGVLAEECHNLLKNFFMKIRKNR